jgi:Tfp pilus assembly major pilin PilA
MIKLKNHQFGFGVIGVLLLAVVVVIVAGAGLLVYNHDHKKAAPLAITKQVTTTTKPVNVYAGWKTYCDAPSKGCFKYPARWSLASNPGGVEVTVTDSSESTTVYYINSDSQDSNSGQAYILGQYSLVDSSLGLKIVGFAQTSSGVAGDFPPEIGVYNASSLTNYPLSTGKTSTIPGAPEFALNNDQEVSFTARPDNAINTQQEAINWEANSTTKTAIEILQSLSTEQ